MNFELGHVVVANEFPRVSAPGNPDGTSIPMWDDTFVKIGFIKADFPMIIVDLRAATFMGVIGPLGFVWVMKNAVKHLK